jgi:hypothetical protein
MSLERKEGFDGFTQNARSMARGRWISLIAVLLACGGIGGSAQAVPNLPITCRVWGTAVAVSDQNYSGTSSWSTDANGTCSGALLGNQTVHLTGGTNEGCLQVIGYSGDLSPCADWLMGVRFTMHNLTTGVDETRHQMWSGLPLPEPRVFRVMQAYHERGEIGAGYRTKIELVSCNRAEESCLYDVAYTWIFNSKI